MPSRDNTAVNVRRLCLDAMLLCAALLLSYLESVLPLTVWLPFPGFKLGLCNVLITAVFIAVSPRDAALISFSRIFMIGLLFGNAASLLFSVCGGVLSYAGLWLFAALGKRVFSMIGVSVGCAALHNIGQLLAAGMLFGTEAIYSYLPMLLVASLLFGTVTGVLLQLLLPRLMSSKTIFLSKGAQKHDEK